METNSQRENVYKLLAIKIIESVIKNFSRRKSGPDNFAGDSYQMFKEELTPVLHRLF